MVPFDLPVVLPGCISGEVKLKVRDGAYVRSNTPPAGSDMPLGLARFKASCGLFQPNA
jgi:hypothetical protein